jgi:hypothetical protein
MKSLHFETSRPVEGPLFVNRIDEIRRLEGAVGKLREGRSSFIAVLGRRKLGKTSLLHEWMRRCGRIPGTVFVPVQCWAWADPDDFFREYLRLTLNAALTAVGAHSEAGLLSLEGDAERVVALAAYAARKKHEGIEEGLRVLAGFDAKAHRASAYRQAVQTPQVIGASDGVRFQFVLDEFQTLNHFDTFKTIRQSFGSIYAMLREEWQKQTCCNYVVSGSSISLMRQILENPSAALFQHFTILPLGPFPRNEAVAMLMDFSKRSGRAIPKEVCDVIVRTVGSNPYYLQVLGEEMVIGAGTEPVGPAAWKRTCQRVLFETSGRLYQYFEQMHVKTAGDSSMLEKILLALAEGPKRGCEIAGYAGVTQNRISSKLPILEKADAIEKEDMTYRICDPCYALWLRAVRAPQPNVMSPLILGDESERRVAREMARQGVGLVYQSRASRGAFDLLAVYQPHQIAVQVRRVKRFPAYLSQRELGRMEHDAAEMGWAAVLAFDCDGEVVFHALSAGNATRRGRRFEKAGALRHVLDAVTP